MGWYSSYFSSLCRSFIDLEILCAFLQTLVNFMMVIYSMHCSFNDWPTRAGLPNCAFHASYALFQNGSHYSASILTLLVVTNFLLILILWWLCLVKWIDWYQYLSRLLYWSQSRCLGICRLNLSCWERLAYSFVH